MCSSRIADKLEIQPDFISVKDYIVNSLEIGMTQDEVLYTLNLVAPATVKNSFVDEEKQINTEVFIKLCDNPLGNVVLLVYYSKDGHLINVVDSYDD